MASSWVSGKDRTKGLGAAVACILSSSFLTAWRGVKGGTTQIKPRPPHLAGRSPALVPGPSFDDRGVRISSIALHS